jgi:hypothetical protein
MHRLRVPLLAMLELLLMMSALLSYRTLIAPLAFRDKN